MRRQQQKPGYNKRLLGPRHAPNKPGGGASGTKQKLPSYKNRMRSIQRLLNKVRAENRKHRHAYIQIIELRCKARVELGLKKLPVRQSGELQQHQ
jgi:hypothetical protein